MLACALHVFGRGDVPKKHVNVRRQLAVVVSYHLRRFAHADVGDLAERDRAPPVADHGCVPDFFERIDVFRRVLNCERHDRLVGFPDSDDVVAAYCEAHGRQGFLHRYAVLCHPLEVELCVHEVAL